MGRLVFYLVRHGETLFNTRNLAQGWCDSPLTGDGIAQARALGRGLGDIPFLAGYSSTSERAVDTAELILEGRSVPVLREKGFREMNFGILEGEPSSRLAEGCSFEKRMQIGWKDVEGETWEELGERSVGTIERIRKQFQETEGNILIVTHGMTISQILKELGDGEVYQAYLAAGPRGFGNCSVTLLEWENGGYCLKAVNDLCYRQRGEAMLKKES